LGQSPTGALSPIKELFYGVDILIAVRSRGTNVTASALRILGESTFLLVNQSSPIFFAQYTRVVVNHLLFRVLRATAECFARLSHNLGVCLAVRLSVCLSVRLLYCIKTVQGKITKSLRVAPRTVFFCDKMLCPCVKGLFFNESVKEEYSS